MHAHTHTHTVHTFYLGEFYHVLSKTTAFALMSSLNIHSELTGCDWKWGKKRESTRWTVNTCDGCRGEVPCRMEFLPTSAFRPVLQPRPVHLPLQVTADFGRAWKLSLASGADGCGLLTTVWQQHPLSSIDWLFSICVSLCFCVRKVKGVLVNFAWDWTNIVPVLFFFSHSGFHTPKASSFVLHTGPLVRPSVVLFVSYLCRVGKPSFNLSLLFQNSGRQEVQGNLFQFVYFWFIPFNELLFQ